MWQDINTTKGSDYTLTFYHSPRPERRSTLTVSINSQVLAKFEENGESLTKFKWAQFKTNFTATSSLTTISFGDVAAAGSGTAIDHVVVELLPLAAGIRVSEVEIRWESVATKSYQIQYTSALTPGQWFDLGAAIPGTGTTMMVTDKVPIGEPQRFYRVNATP